MSARVASVNVGAVREVEWHGRTMRTGIFKSPVAGRVAVRGVNLAGDDQGDRTVHGGTDKAVYSYAVEDYAFWRGAEGFETPPGLFGENLTLEGIELGEAMSGDRWKVGSALLEVSQPRMPCAKLGMRMDDAEFPKRFQRAGRMGAYLRIIEAGEIGAGDVIHVVSRAAHGITLRAMLRALDDPDQAAALRAIPKLPRFWRQVLERAEGR